MNLGFELFWLEPNKIARKELFFFSPHRIEIVHRLIDYTGMVVCPLWVRQEGERYTLIDGYCRISWAERKNKPVPCLLFPEEIPESDLLIWKVFDLISRRDPDVFEKAKIVKALASFCSPAEIKERFFPFLKIPLKPRMFKTMLMLAELSDEEISKIMTGQISEKVLFRIIWWDVRSRRACVELLSALRCSVNLQKELVELIDDIARLEDASQAEIIEQQEVLEVLKDQKISPRDKTDRLRRSFRRRIYPSFERRERSFHKIMKELSLPTGVALRPPEFFEGDMWSLSVSFSGAEELRKSLEWVLQEKIFSGLSKAIEGGDE